MAALPRRKSVVVNIGGVKVGGSNPIVVQSMTNTDTADTVATVNQVMELARAGSELVRATVNTEEAAQAVPRIVDTLLNFGVTVPIIGDFHYNGHLLLKKYPECARALSKYRINPGNVDIGKRHDNNFRTMIEVAIEYDRPVRIGVNWGSLDAALLTRMMDENSRSPEPLDAMDVTKRAIVESAIRSGELAEQCGLSRDKIILSAKVSNVQDLIDVYQMLALRCDYPLHLGLTEAGLGSKGIVASTAALSVLLQQGIGDTIRASLTPLPNGDRSEEVIVCQQILQALNLRSFTPQVAACPGCGRTTSTFFQDMADQIQTYLREQMPLWREKYSGVEEMKVAVMGCVVNGPGESKHANIGISLPGTFEKPVAPVYIDGKLSTTLRGEHIVAEFRDILDNYVAQRYGTPEPVAYAERADELAKLQSAVEALSTQVAQLEQRMTTLEHGRKFMSSSSPAPVQPAPIQTIGDPSTIQLPPKQLESRLGLTIVNRIGAITLAIGILFFFKYAADNQWIGASGRVVLGLLGGLILIGVADWLRRRDQRVFSQGVCGCGLAIVYISLYASFAYYQIVPQAGAFFLMIAACALAVVLSFRYDHPAIAALGLIGGFLTPPLLHTRNEDPWLLLPYLLFLDAFSIAIALRRRWAILHVIAFAGTAILFIAWASEAGPGKIGIGWFFLFVFFALFFGAAIQSFRRTEQTMPLVLLALNAFWTLVSSSTLSHGDDSSWIALFALVLAIIYFVGARTTRDSPRLSMTLYVIGDVCFLDAVIRELETWATHNVEPLARASFISESVSVFLALYAVAMITFGVLKKRSADRVIGLVLIGIVVAKLYFYDVWLLTRFYRVSAFVALGILLLAASYVYSRLKDKLDLFLK